MLISIVSHDRAKMAAFFLLFVVMWLESCILMQVQVKVFFLISSWFCDVLESYLRDLFQKEYHSSVNFNTDPVLEIKKLLVSMPLRGGGFYICHSTYARKADEISRTLL